MRGQPGHGKGVNELQWRIIPLLASPQGGVAASSKKFREATEADAAGVVSIGFIRKTTLASRSADASQYLPDRSATPPCGDARRGISACFQFIHTFIDRRYSFPPPSARLNE